MTSWAVMSQKRPTIVVSNVYDDQLLALTHVYIVVVLDGDLYIVLHGFPHIL